MVGIAEVAARAGVSPAVVSRVLSKDSRLRISPETRARVLQAVTDLQYVPSHTARSLRMRLPSALTLVMPDATNSVHSELVRGVESAARERELAVMLASSERINEGREWLRRIVREGRTDGVIFQPPPDLGSAAVRSVTELPAPVVVINWDEESAERTIVFDDAAGAEAAVRHLAERGHRDVGFAGATPGHAPGARRLQGFETALGDLGLARRPAWITHEGLTSEDGRSAARQLLRAPRLPTAVVVANINAALGFLAEMHANDVEVPAQLSIIAFHDVWLADATWPPLTTVRMPFHEMGVAAVDMLFADGSPAGYHIKVKRPRPIIVSRQSVKVLPCHP